MLGKKVVVFLEFHTQGITKKFLAENGAKFNADGYDLIADESELDRVVKPRQLVEEGEKRIEDLFVRLKQPMLSESAANNIKYLIINNQWRNELYKELAKSNFEVRGCDPLVKRYKNALEVRPDLLRAMTSLRDENIAEELEKIRKEAQTNKRGVVAIIGKNHINVQHFLLKFNANAINDYCFFYFYKKPYSITEMYQFKEGFDRSEVFPLGVTAVDCDNKTPETIYRSVIREIIQRPRQLSVTESRLNKLFNLLEEDKKRGRKAIAVLDRITITIAALDDYIKNSSGKNLDPDKLFHLSSLVLLQFNQLGLLYCNVKFPLSQNVDLLNTVKIEKNQIANYQDALDKLIPKIQAKFIEKNLHDSAAKDFMFAGSLPSRVVQTECLFYRENPELTLLLHKEGLKSPPLENIAVPAVKSQQSAFNQYCFWAVAAAVGMAATVAGIVIATQKEYQP